MKVKALVGSGERIGLLTLPFLAVGLTANILVPSVFEVGGPPALLRAVSIAVLIAGVIGWAWSVALILTKVPRGELITGGPFALVRHPLYTSAALLVLPWAGFLLDTWLGVVLGAAVYVGSRLFSPKEEESLSRTFGPAWDEYTARVALPWL